MYFRCNAGGWNKTHEQVERTPRIDSFELAFTHAWGGLFCGGEYLDIYLSLIHILYLAIYDTSLGEDPRCGE